MGNFEAKHPRAKDGKFTEKRRTESGLTLESALVGESGSLTEEDNSLLLNASGDGANVLGLDPADRAAFAAYSAELVANGLVPDVEEFEDSFQGEYASFDDFAAGYANDMVFDCEDYEVINEFFDYDAYERDTGFSEEQAEELIESGDGETIKRYFDYGAFAKDLETSYSIEDAPGGNVFVFQAN